MPGWAKALLIILGVMVVLVIGAVVIGVIYLASHKEEWRVRGREIAGQGREFGAKSDYQGCVDESIVRYKKEPGFINAFMNNGFMRSCLEASRPTPGFCREVPVGEMAKLVSWRSAKCTQYGLEHDSNCERFLFMPVVVFCGEQKGKER